MVRSVTPTPPRAAQHALTVLSPAPELLAATRALLRASLLAGDAPRTGKEVVAAGVCRAIRCRLLVDTPEHPGNAALAAWASASGTADQVAPPFPRRFAPEYVGTALAFHFIGRMVSALLPGTSLPPFVASAGEPDPRWIAGTPVGAAFTALRTAAARGRSLLSHEAEAVFRDAVNAWDGGHPPLGHSWLAGPLGALPEADRPAARLALLAALAPYRVTDADVAAWRTTRSSDADLVRLLGFGAITAVDRIAEWLGAGRL